MHKAYPMNAAPRVGYDWRIMCRACGDHVPKEIGRAERRSEAVKAANDHNKGNK